MTTLPLTAPAAITRRAPAAESQRWRAGLPQAVRAEWTKLVSLRSTRWTLLITAVGTFLVSYLATHSALHHSKSWYQGFDPTSQSLTGLAIGSLALGVLGILAVSGEYGSGTIRSSLAAMPRRGVLLTAKVVVVGAVTLVVGEALSFLIFFGGQAVMKGGAPTATLGQPGVLRAVALSGLFMALFALLGLGLGVIIRHTAGAIAVFAGVTFLIPILFNSISHNIARFSPELIFGNSIASTVNEHNHALSVTMGTVCMLAYCAAALGLGAVLLQRRDA
jgi:ABC-type transport system involved in multi-copper enzyme maturation permease subunit